MLRKTQIKKQKKEFKQNRRLSRKGEGKKVKTDKKT